jgi:hypothetical protein
MLEVLAQDNPRLSLHVSLTYLADQRIAYFLTADCKPPTSNGCVT